MFYRLESIVDKKLRTHPDKSKSINNTNKSIQNIAVPTFVLVIIQRINRIANQNRKESVRHVFHSFCVEFLSFRLFIGFFIFKPEVGEFFYFFYF